MRTVKFILSIEGKDGDLDLEDPKVWLRHRKRLAREMVERFKNCVTVGACVGGHPMTIGLKDADDGEFFGYADLETHRDEDQVWFLFKEKVNPGTVEVIEDTFGRVYRRLVRPEKYYES